jgi:hypothetical protein
MADLGQSEVSQIGALLEKTLVEQGGVVGFSTPQEISHIHEYVLISIL